MSPIDLFCRTTRLIWGMDSCNIRGDNDELAQISAAGVADIAIPTKDERLPRSFTSLMNPNNRSDLPIIVFISLNNALLRERLSSYDALTVVQKPIKPSTLYNAIQMNLESSVASEMSHPRIQLTSMPGNRKRMSEFYLLKTTPLIKRLHSSCLSA